MVTPSSDGTSDEDVPLPRPEGKGADFVMSGTSAEDSLVGLNTLTGGNHVLGDWRDQNQDVDRWCEERETLHDHPTGQINDPIGQRDDWLAYYEEELVSLENEHKEQLEDLHNHFTSGLESPQTDSLPRAESCPRRESDTDPDYRQGVSDQYYCDTGPNDQYTLGVDEERTDVVCPVNDQRDDRCELAYGDNNVDPVIDCQATDRSGDSDNQCNALLGDHDVDSTTVYDPGGDNYVEGADYSPHCESDDANAVYDPGGLDYYDDDDVYDPGGGDYYDDDDDYDPDGGYYYDDDDA